MSKVIHFLIHVYLCRSGYSSEYRYCFSPWVEDPEMLSKWFLLEVIELREFIYFCLWISPTASVMNLTSYMCAFAKIIMFSYLCLLEWSVGKYLQYFQHSLLHISSLYITWENWLLALIAIITNWGRQKKKRNNFFWFIHAIAKPNKIL